MGESRGGSGIDQGGVMPPFSMSNFPAFHRSLDARHLEEQADGRTLTKDRAAVCHDLTIFAHVKGRRDRGTSGLKGAPVVVVTREPG